jgi:hypothetical protein
MGKLFSLASLLLQTDTVIKGLRVEINFCHTVARLHRPRLKAASNFTRQSFCPRARISALSFLCANVTSHRGDAAAGLQRCLYKPFLLLEKPAPGVSGETEGGKAIGPAGT